MQGYEEDEYDDYLDEYETEGEEQEYGEEEYEKEEPQQPSQDCLEYMELRKKLKEAYRKQMVKEQGGGSSRSKTNSSARDDYGSFFGPKEPVIAQRVIQESRSLLENPHLAARVMKSSHPSNKSSASKPGGSKTTPSNHAPKTTTHSNLSGLKRKREMVKHTRDYSFLNSDDAEFPAPSKGPLTHKVTAPNYDARRVQLPSGNQSSNGRKQILDDREVKRGSSQIQQPKAAIPKSSAISKPTQQTLDSRKQFASSNGSGPGRPLGPKGVPTKVTGNQNDKKYSAPGAKSTAPNLHRPVPSKSQPSVPRPSSVQSRVAIESGKSKPMPKQGVSVSRPQMSMQKQPVSSSKPQVKPPPPRSVDRHPSVQQRDDRRPSLPQRDNRRPVVTQRDDRRPSHPQRDDRRPSVSQRDDRRPSVPLRDDRRPSVPQRDDRRSSLPQRDDRRPLPQKRPVAQQKDDRRPALHRKDERRPPARKPTRYDDDEDEGNAISLIRNMFGYNPNRYRDEDDVSDMEANFDQILEEEKHSARIAREEDEEELKKIEEEERRERMRKQAKKRKLSH